MAVVKLGPIVADIRGSVGDVTFSRNQGGIIARTRQGPAGLPTPNQIEVTDAMTLLSQAWSADLTDAQRNTWRQYAHQFPETNRWGTPSLTNGYCRFISINFLHAQQAAAVLTQDPPTRPPLWPPSFEFRARAYNNCLYIKTPDLPPDDLDDDYTFYLFEGIIVLPGVNFYIAPFTFLRRNTSTWNEWYAYPASEWGVISAHVLNIDDKIFLRLRMQHDASHAISPPYIASTLVY